MMVNEIAKLPKPPTARQQLLRVTRSLWRICSSSVSVRWWPLPGVARHQRLASRRPAQTETVRARITPPALQARPAASRPG